MRKFYLLWLPGFGIGRGTKLSLLILFLISLCTVLQAQVVLTGTSYTESFDALESDLPNGIYCFTGATASSLGTPVTSVTKTTWAVTSGNFRNVASADGLNSSTSTTDQNNATDRALAVRQTGSFGDPGAAFGIKLASTSGFQDFQLSLKLQSLDVSSARTTTFSIQYGIGESPTTFVTSTTQAIGGSQFTNNTINISLGNALDNISEPVWIRIVALSNSTGSGSRATTGLDDFSLTYTSASTDPTVGVSTTALSDVSYFEGEGPSTAATFTVTGSNLSSSIPITVEPPANFELSTDGITFSPISLSLTPSEDGSVNELIYSRLVAGLSTNTYSGTITVSSSEVAESKIVVANGKVSTIVKIHDIQGSGSTFNTAYSGQQRIEGIVTRKFSGSTQLNGFYVQEEDADADADPATSEGIFIYDPAGLFTGNEGDKVQVTGTVAEYATSSSGVSSSLTQLSNLLAVINLGASTLPTATTVTLPVTNVADLEAYEGMLVTMSAASGNLTVTEHYQLQQYGQILLSVTGASNETDTDARLDQYTQFHTPSVSGYADYLAELAKRSIILDDASSTSYPNPILFGRGGNALSASNTLRGGDEVTSITTVLDERYEGYRLQTNTGVNFTATNTRPTTPPSVGGTLKVASANVLNYFNGNGTGGGFPTSRGATTAAEFTRQRAKVLQNLYGSGADIIGLMEIENDGYGSTSAIQDLVNGLNDLAGPSSYTFVNPGTSIATDAITVGMIYKLASVTTIGIPASLSTSADFNGVGRLPLAQTFRQTSTGGVVTVVVNHFKSKGSSQGGTGDTDILDGQGSSNGTRTRQAQALADWLGTNPTGVNDPDYLIIGDLNAYAKEDPLTTLETAGYANLVPNTTYSYVYDGQWGALDHALGSSSLTSQVTGAGKWHINADEPTALDYNVENKTTEQQASLYNADQFRSSDHDPVVVGLNLTPSPLPDLVATMMVSPTVINNESPFSVVVHLDELKAQPTGGIITVRIAKDPTVSLTLNEGTTLIGGQAVQNSQWAFDNTDESYYQLTTTTSILANARLSFGLSGTFIPSGAGTLPFSVVVLGGSGGEGNTANNNDAEIVDYFQQ